MTKSLTLSYKATLDLDKACEEFRARLNNPLAVQRYLERQARVSAAWVAMAQISTARKMRKRVK